MWFRCSSLYLYLFRLFSGFSLIAILRSYVCLYKVGKITKFFFERFHWMAFKEYLHEWLTIIVSTRAEELIVRRISLCCLVTVRGVSPWILCDPICLLASLKSAFRINELIEAHVESVKLFEEEFYKIPLILWEYTFVWINIKADLYLTCVNLNLNQL